VCVWCCVRVWCVVCVMFGVYVWCVMCVCGVCVWCGVCGVWCVYVCVVCGVWCAWCALCVVCVACRVYVCLWCLWCACVVCGVRALPATRARRPKRVSFLCEARGSQLPATGASYPPQAYVFFSAGWSLLGSKRGQKGVRINSERGPAGTPGRPWIFNFCSWCLLILNMVLLGSAYISWICQNIDYFVGIMSKMRCAHLRRNFRF
jgi:hypothetical protein